MLVYARLSAAVPHSATRTSLHPLRACSPPAPHLFLACSCSLACPAAQQRRQRRVRRPHGHPRVPPVARRPPPQHLHHPRVRARHQPRQRRHGGHEDRDRVDRRAGEGVERVEQWSGSCMQARGRGLSRSCVPLCCVGIYHHPVQTTAPRLLSRRSLQLCTFVPGAFRASVRMMMLILLPRCVRCVGQREHPRAQGQGH